MYLSSARCYIIHQRSDYTPLSRLCLLIDARQSTTIRTLIYDTHDETASQAGGQPCVIVFIYTLNCVSRKLQCIVTKFANCRRNMQTRRRRQRARTQHDLHHLQRWSAFDQSSLALIIIAATRAACVILTRIPATPPHSKANAHVYQRAVLVG